METTSAFLNYEQAVEWINSFVTSQGIKPGLNRMQAIMDRLGHPERRLKFIHVAGTNGKGSVCAMLDSVLRKAGYSTGLFTSPYLERFNERIQHDGTPIPEAELLRITNMLKPIAEDLAKTELGAPSMFELVTAIAILYFATVAYPDYVIWETGLGGRLDSTNIVIPILSLITNIGHDHMDLLGDTLEKIAAEKAGIIKAGVPVVTTEQNPEALHVLRQKASERNAALYELNQHFRFERTTESDSLGERFHFEGPFRTLSDVELSLMGQHQVQNASAALMALEVLRQYYALIVEDEDLYAALRETRWAGRLERVQESPLVLLDGAHNPEGAAALTAVLRERFGSVRIHAMLGMLNTKNHIDVLRHILPIVATLTITEPDFRNAQKTEELAALASQLREELQSEAVITSEQDWQQALAGTLARAGEGEIVLVTGSLYLISDARSWLLHRTQSEKGW